MEERLQRIERKRETLKMLQSSLQDWEKEIDSADIPADRHDSFRALADASIDSLESMVNRLNTEIREGLAEIVAMKYKGRG